MITGNVTYKCWFCSSDIRFELEEDSAIHYEENKTEGGLTIKETYTSTCSKCSTSLMVSLKQFRAGGLLELDKRRGRNQ